MFTAIQGFCAGGAASTLLESVTDSVQKRVQAQWDYIALQSNHTLLLAGTVLKAAALEVQFFSPFAKGVFFLTPFVMMAGVYFKNRLVTEWEVSVVNKLSRFNFTVSIISTIALLILGERSYALSSLILLSTHFLSQKVQLRELSKIHSGVSFISTTLAFLGYANWIMSSNFSTLTKVALCVTSVAFIISQTPPSEEEDMPLRSNNSSRESRKKNASISDSYDPFYHRQYREYGRPMNQTFPDWSQSVPSLNIFSPNPYYLESEPGVNGGS